MSPAESADSWKEASRCCRDLVACHHLSGQGTCMDCHSEASGGAERPEVGRSGCGRGRRTTRGGSWQTARSLDQTNAVSGWAFKSDLSKRTFKVSSSLDTFVIHTVQSIKSQGFWRNSWLLVQKITFIFLQLTHPRIPAEAAGANFRGSGRAFPAWRRCSARALQGVHGQLNSGLRRLLGAMDVLACKKIHESTPPSRSCSHRIADR